VKENYTFRSDNSLDILQKEIDGLRLIELAHQALKAKEIEYQEEIEKSKARIEKLEGECQEIQRQKDLIANKLSNKPIELGTISLYSGDVITLKSESGEYLKRADVRALYRIRQEVQTTDARSTDEPNYFMVEVVEGNKVRLRVPNKNLYCKVNDHGNKSVITFTDNPHEELTVFLINKKGNDNRVTLQVVDNELF